MQKEENDLAMRTKSFAVRIIRLFSALPKTTEAQVIGKQVLRSGTSVGANYREASRGRSKAEFIAKCGDSLRELEETDTFRLSPGLAELSAPGRCHLHQRPVCDVDIRELIPKTRPAK